MNSRIHHLDSLTIDKIAAGEVIDIPASCVKELVENSLDAGAKSVLVEIQLGGRELIRVTDSGCGMCQDDVECSIERHATSKIVCVEDLEKISSMGFRGEALASIVAIARVKITSGEHKGTSPLVEATTLIVEGGEKKSLEKTSSIPGTIVEVRDIFYNIPARRKFLKSPSKDTQDIIKTVTSLSLAFPDVSFRLRVDGKDVLSANLEKDHSFIARAKKVLGEPFQSGLELIHDQDGFSLHGIVCLPETAKANRSGQYLFVNGRHVSSLPISYAVKSGYGTAIEQQKHPQFVLSLVLDPSTIDINVHPQKKEIRFADEEWVRSLVQERVSEALFGKRALSFSHEERDPVTEWSFPAEQISSTHHAQRELFNFEEKKVEETPRVKNRVLVVLGKIALIEREKNTRELLLLDLERAMKAVLFKDLMEQKGSPLVETLLIPVTISCTKEEASLVASRSHEFEKEGFLLRPFGPSSFLVESVPQGLKDIDVGAFITEMVHHPEVFQERNEASRCVRLAGLYVSLMKCLEAPVSLETAEAVLRRFQDCGSPRVAPDGSVCSHSLSPDHFQEYFK